MAAEERGLEERRESASAGVGRYYTPRADVQTRANDILVLIDLPGVNEADLDITVEKNVLTVTGKTDPITVEKAEPRYGEFALEGFQRSFALTDGVDTEKIQASLKDGVLRLTLPKSEKMKPRRIPISQTH